ncbi:signal peptidase I [Undibacterium sp. CY18W]|uniref:Signal peptidase I n=1 Tax=Undibacterium hunanense TaxID=2762292 RepID=A0ABR6ZT66_9BURK|nr:signal peptidase I [Undibacterium hunanense]MBC3919093.1 signal peptidase I [Undibacterium hunanense]
MNTEYKPRPWLAVLLNVFVPGLGFVYLNRLALAAANILFFPLVLLIAGRAGLVFSAPGFLLVTLVLTCFWLASSIVVFRLARRQSMAARGWLQRWYVLLAVGMVGYAVVQYCMSIRGTLFGYDIFNVPGMSMETTLLSGDKFIANTLAYADAGHTPQRGDVVVLQNPAQANVKYVKRIMGLPDEQVSMRDGSVLINGKAIADEHAFHDLSKPDQTMNQQFTVPPDSYFVLGDNRNDSLDSRHFGPVPAEKIYARVELVWFSYGISSVRWDRLGLAVK